MPTVALATEFDDYDAEIYRALLALTMQQDVVRWPTELRFNGCRSVRHLMEPFLRQAEKSDVRHALFAIDNDGGARRHPEHDDLHDVAAQARDEVDGCRHCWLTDALPAWWTEGGRRAAIVVPVQTLETWLLTLRGDDLLPSAEQVYNRDVLKKRFFGRPKPPITVCRDQALTLLKQDDALERLRRRPSFRRFEVAIDSWRVHPSE